MDNGQWAFHTGMYMYVLWTSEIAFFDKHFLNERKMNTKMGGDIKNQPSSATGAPETIGNWNCCGECGGGGGGGGA